MRVIGWIFTVAMLLMVPACAQAQSTLLQGGPVTAGHAPMYVNTGSSQAVVQDSGPAAGGAVGLGMGEGLYVARGTGTPPYAGQGSGQFGANWCDYDAPITNATGYHYLCMSPNAQGGGLIAYGSAGSASAKPLQFYVNGTIYDIANILPPSQIAANTLLGNSTGSLAVPAPVAVPSCSTASSALTWQSNNGFGCNAISAIAKPGSPTTVHDLVVWAATDGSQVADATWQSVVGFYNALDPRWGTSTCSSVPCGIGTGGDDSAPINAAFAYVVTHGGGTLYFPAPSSGNYNVCTTGAILNPANAIPDVVMEFGTAGSYALRVLPGCGSPPDSVLTIQNVGYGGLPQVRSTGRVKLENVRLDGYCLANHDLHIGFLVGFDSTNSIYRNVAPGGTNIQDGDDPIATSPSFNIGYDHTFDASNRAENLNEAGHVCYSTYATLPRGNVEIWATDSVYSLTAINAEFFNFATMFGGADDLSHVHGWGYPAGNAESQPLGEPLANMYSRGPVKAVMPVWDTPAIFGMRSTVVPTSGMVNSATVGNVGASGTPGFTLLTGTTGTGTKATYYAYVDNTGKIAGPLMVWAPGTYSVAPTSPDPVTSGTGLTGATVLPVMGNATLSGLGPYIIDPVFEGDPTGRTGMSVGANVAGGTLIGGVFAGFTTTCYVNDTGSTPATFFVMFNTSCATGAIAANQFNVGTTAAAGIVNYPFATTNYMVSAGTLQTQIGSTPVINVLLGETDFLTKIVNSTMPTSCSGQPAGTLRNNSGVVNVC